MSQSNYRTVYKVCRPGKLSLYEDNAIRYRRDRYVKPAIAGSKLFVFATLADARKHQVNTYSRASTIWQARARNCRPQSIRLPRHDTGLPVAANVVAVFWHLLNGGGLPVGYTTHNCPTGTLVADAVKLVKPLKRKRRRN